MNDLHAVGYRLITLLQQARSDALDGVMLGLTFLGDEPFYLLLIPILYWTMDRAVALRLTVLLLVSTWINGVGKALVDLPRPSSAEVAVLAEESAGGVPSGHAQNAVVVWGYLASLRPGVWTVAAAALAALAIGTSRLYLGVHFPHDLVVGWALGLVLLFLFLRLHARVEDGLAAFLPAPSPRGWALLLLLGGGIPLAMLLLYREHEALAAAAALLGAGLGAVWERTRIRFSARGPLLHLAPRLVLGLGVALLIWMGLREPLAVLGEPGRILRYALLGLWITAGAPVSFLVLGIGEREAAR